MEMSNHEWCISRRRGHTAHHLLWWIVALIANVFAPNFEKKKKKSCTVFIITKKTFEGTAVTLWLVLWCFTIRGRAGGFLMLPLNMVRCLKKHYINKWYHIWCSNHCAHTLHTIHYTVHLTIVTSLSFDQYTISDSLSLSPLVLHDCIGLVKGMSQIRKLWLDLHHTTTSVYILYLSWNTVLSELLRFTTRWRSWQLLQFDILLNIQSDVRMCKQPVSD